MEKRGLQIGQIYLAPLLSFVLLAGLAAEWTSYHLPSEDTTPYHRAVAAAAEDIPYKVGDWVSTDTELPRSAVALLKPNVLLGRRFKNLVTGQRVQVLFIQCAEARDLAGHHPQRCYPSSGWSIDNRKPRDWQVGDLTIKGTEYLFSTERLAGQSQIVVYHFVVRPDGGIERDTTGLQEAAVDPRKRPWGGAQVQFVFSDGATLEERDRAFTTLMPILIPVIDVVQSMVSK
jgi:hypothetical protein